MPIGHASAQALDLGFATRVHADRRNLFSRIIWNVTIQDAEAKGIPAAPAWFKLKKADLAALAEREIAGTGWLPQPLRPLASPDEAETDAVMDLDTAA